MPPSTPRKVCDFPGGIHPADNKIQSLELELGTLSLPDRFIVPVNQHSGSPAKPVVEVGNKVLKGQLIAAATDLVSASVHAPTSGVVTHIDQQPVPHPSGMTALCITIEPDGEEQWVERHNSTDYRNETPGQLLERIRQAGIAGLGGAGFPTAVKLSPVPASGSDHSIKTLIINATECEPYITADDMLMRSYPQQVVEGIKILAHILGEPEEILIGIEDNKTLAYDAIEPLLKETNIELVEFPTKYPSGGEKQLIQLLTGQELPNGKLPADIGIICQNVGTTHAVYRAIVEDTPLISRITTVTGEACAVKRNFEILIGTPIGYVLEQCGFDSSHCNQVTMGGPMMGFNLPDITVPVIKTTNCILAPTVTEMPPAPPAQPCIRCGACAEVCPASLLPQQLFWYARDNNHQRLQSHNLFDCIECGACAYVCPSHIPLVQYYRAAKGEIRQLAQEKIKADRARERFEFNRLRKERAEAEKAAKREARWLAAEQARTRLATQEPTGGTPASTAQPDDVVQAALAKVAAKQLSPEQQQAKLERSISSTESRLQRLQKKLAEGESADADPQLTPEQIDGYKAQIESARHKLTEARQKLAAFGNDRQHGSENDDSMNSFAINPSAINKAKAKVLASPRQTLEAKIASLEKRITDIEGKIAACDDDSLCEALNNSLNKFRGKLQDARNDLDNLPADGNQPVTNPDTIAATERAIASARSKQQARQQQSTRQQLESTAQRLQQRILKARKQLADTDDPSQQQALDNSIIRMEQKLADINTRLEQTPL